MWRIWNEFSTSTNRHVMHLKKFLKAYWLQNWNKKCQYLWENCLIKTNIFFSHFERLWWEKNQNILYHKQLSAWRYTFNYYFPLPICYPWHKKCNHRPRFRFQGQALCARSFKSQCNAYFRFTIFLQIRFLSNQLNLYAACTFLSGLKSFKNLDEFSDLTLDFVFYFVSQSSQIFFHQRNWHKND